MKRTILLAVIFATGFYVNAQNRFANSFTGDFNDSTFKNFRYGSTGNKSGFKWRSGVNSPERYLVHQ